MRKFILDDFPANMIYYYNEVPYISDNADQAPIKIGSKVQKTNSEEGDNMEDGKLGKVIGSISQGIEFEGTIEYGYTVIWDGQDLPVMTIGRKLKSVK